MIHDASTHINYSLLANKPPANAFGDSARIPGLERLSMKVTLH